MVKKKSKKQVAETVLEEKEVKITDQSAESEEPKVEATRNKKHGCLILFILFAIIAGPIAASVALGYYGEYKASQTQIKKEDEKITYVTEANSYKKHEAKSVAAVFVYENEEIPDEIMNTLCDSDKTNPNSYAHVPYWYKYQASSYNVDLNINLNCVKKKIKIPQEYMPDPNKTFDCHGKQVKGAMKDPYFFSEYLKKTYPELKNYDYLAITKYGEKMQFPCQAGFAMGVKGKSFYTFISKAFDSEEAQALLGQEHNRDFYYPTLTSQNLPVTFAHELAHLLGATDKYLVDSNSKKCKVDPKTGMPYSENDLMCTAQGHIFKEVGITEPTAKELGWK